MYDSTADTQAHIKQVQYYIKRVTQTLAQRAFVHDYHKLRSPEKEGFDAAAELKTIEYGSDEYRASLENLKEVLLHHYAHTKHHPESFAIKEDGTLDTEAVKNGAAINRMNLLDLIEMLCDWKAASERHDGGNIYKSIDMNQERFGYDDDMKELLTRTARAMNWE